LNQSPDSLRAIGAFLLLIYTAPVHSAQYEPGPFQTRDQNPLNMVYGQPLPVTARLPDPDRTGYTVTLDIANTLNGNIDEGDALLLDFESYVLTTTFSYGLAENWALKIDIPLISRNGGFLDHTIDRWHTFFGLPRASRPKVDEDQIGIVYSSFGLAEIDISKPTNGIGDVQLSIGHQLAAAGSSAISLWLAVDLPTGDRDMLNGNGVADYSVWIAAENRLNMKWAIDANAGVVLPGNSVIASLQTSNVVAFGHAGLRWSVYPAIDLKLQLAGHSAFYRDTSMKMLGKSYILVFGGTARLGHCSALDIGVSEDIKVGASPDVTFLASWISLIGDCDKALW
jgi:hypothetical protein